MADYLTTDTELTSIANAIRTKGGTSEQLEYPTEFVSAIQAISTGTDVSDTTATASDVLNGKYFYNSSGVKTQGNIASKTSSDMSASGLTVTAPAGYYASNGTKTLTDANLLATNIKKDVTIFGVTGSYEGQKVTVQETQDIGGGTIVTITGDVTSIPSFDQRGQEGEIIATFAEISKKFSETTYSTWSPSTTATTIFASQSISPTYSLNLASYDYMVEWTVKIDAVYPSVTAASTLKRYYKMYTYIIKIPNGDDTRNVNITNTHDFIDFYNASSAHGGNSDIGTYSLYSNAQAATFNSETSNTPTVTFKTPLVGARCNTTYFSTTAAAALDQANSTIKISGVLWRFPKDKSAGGAHYKDVITLVNGGNA